MIWTYLLLVPVLLLTVVYLGCVCALLTHFTYNVKFKQSRYVTTMAYYATVIILSRRVHSEYPTNDSIVEIVANVYTRAYAKGSAREFNEPRLPRNLLYVPLRQKLLPMAEDAFMLGVSENNHA